MLIQASTILGLPVAAIDSQSKIGEVKKIIFNPENGEIMAFLIKKGGFFSKEKLLSSQDALDIDKNGLVVKTDESLVEIGEIIRVEKILKENITIINQKAITDSGKNIGKVNDLLLDSTVMAIVKYYIHGMIQDRIIPSEKIIKINKKAVVFSNDVIEETPSAQIEEAAA